MAKVSLRAYNHEIEGMVEAGQIDEAIAHCQHILKTFSLHVATYRLLGKAFLEGRRYGDAADIFQRILMSVPDDFVAHVGMSIIRDNEKNLDEAIWHMERAFEVQPSNPAIQAEMRRLYGRRDGVEPPKIRLSRDALANMYAQGELFNQAIAEIRTVLAEDPNRPDLQVMLARAYFRNGQKVEAAEISANLLKKYPYCLDALRILVEVLPGSARAENTQVYRQRLRLIDPYTSFVTGSVFQSDQVADSAVTLERLDYVPGTAPALPTPSWADSLGIKLDDSSKREAEPEWLAAGSPVVKPPSPVEPASPVPGPTLEKGEESIPDWMRSVGWKPSTGEAAEAPVEPAEVPPAELNAPTEIPEWLRSIAPPEAGLATGTPGVESAPQAIPDESSNIPGWLAGIPEKPESPEGGETGMAPEPSGLAKDEPLVPGIPSTPEAKPPAVSPEMSPQGGQEISHEWLKGQPTDQVAKEEPIPAPEGGQEEVPDWLRSTIEAPPPPKATQEPSTSPRKTIHFEPSPLPQEEPGSTQKGLTPTAGEPEFLPSQSAAAEPPIETPAKPVPIEDDTMAWLESLAAKQGAKPEELLTKPEERPETPPEWIQRAAEEKPSPPTPTITPAPSTSAVPIPEVPEGSSISEPTPLMTGDDITITSWLNKLDVQKELGVPLKPPAEKPPVNPAEDLPEWLKAAEKPASTAKPSAPEEVPLQPSRGEEPTTWIDENPLIAQAPAPTEPGEWIPAEKAEPAEGMTTPAKREIPVAPPIAQPPAEPPQYVPPRVTGTLAKVPTTDKDAELLTIAQSALEGNQLNEAMQEYGKLIKKGRLLDEVIHDLREATYRFPVDIIIWQTLGDAYMRINHLQEALDAYTKAEELLR